MRDILTPFLLIPSFLSTLPVNVEEAEGWWEKAQKHGVGFVFFLLFLSLAVMSYFREKKATEAQVKRDAESNAERLDMQTQIRDLNKAQLEQQTKHSTRLEQLVTDNTKAMSDHGAEMRNLVRKMKRPCVLPLNTEDDA